MPACAAYGCTNRKSNKTPGITFHRFPKDTDRRQQWIKALRRENWTPTSNSLLCSSHFKETDIDRTSLCVVRIRDEAVPSIFPEYLKPKGKGRRKIIRSEISVPMPMEVTAIESPPPEQESSVSTYDRPCKMEPIKEEVQDYDEPKTSISEEDVKNIDLKESLPVDMFVSVKMEPQVTEEFIPENVTIKEEEEEDVSHDEYDTTNLNEGSRICNNEALPSQEYDCVHNNFTLSENNEKPVLKNLQEVNPSYIASVSKIEMERCRNSQFSCGYCKKSFRYRSHFTAHLRSHTGERPFHCDLCKKSFSTNDHLIRHIRSHHAEFRPYCCELCIKSFFNIDSLNRHMESHHEDGNFFCTVCSKSFSKKSKISHLRTHTGDRPFHCEVCGKSFTKKSHVVYHMRSHTNDRPYSCDICNKTFSQKSNLQVHKSTHNKDRLIFCDICNKTFSRNESMILHKRIHTGDRLFSCDICNKTFNFKDHLKEHMRIHSGDRPFTCDVCSRTFTRKSHLFSHKRIHREYYFHCEMCGTFFIDEKELAMHKKNHIEIKSVILNTT